MRKLFVSTFALLAVSVTPSNAVSLTDASVNIAVQPAPAGDAVKTGSTAASVAETAPSGDSTKLPVFDESSEKKSEPESVANSSAPQPAASAENNATPSSEYLKTISAQDLLVNPEFLCSLFKPGIFTKAPYVSGDGWKCELLLDNDAMDAILAAKAGKTGAVKSLLFSEDVLNSSNADIPLLCDELAKVFAGVFAQFGNDEDIKKLLTFEKDFTFNTLTKHFKSLPVNQKTLSAIIDFSEFSVVENLVGPVISLGIEYSDGALKVNTEEFKSECKGRLYLANTAADSDAEVISAVNNFSSKVSEKMMKQMTEYQELEAELDEVSKNLASKKAALAPKITELEKSKTELQRVQTEFKETPETITQTVKTGRRSQTTTTANPKYAELKNKISELEKKIQDIDGEIKKELEPLEATKKSLEAKKADFADDSRFLAALELRDALKKSMNFILNDFKLIKYCASKEKTDNMDSENYTADISDNELKFVYADKQTIENLSKVSKMEREIKVLQEDIEKLKNEKANEIKAAEDAEAAAKAELATAEAMPATVSQKSGRRTTQVPNAARESAIAAANNKIEEATLNLQNVKGPLAEKEKQLAQKQAEYEKLKADSQVVQLIAAANAYKAEVAAKE